MFDFLFVLLDLELFEGGTYFEVYVFILYQFFVYKPRIRTASIPNIIFGETLPSFISLELLVAFIALEILLEALNVLSDAFLIVFE